MNRARYLGIVLVVWVGVGVFPRTGDAQTACRMSAEVQRVDPRGRILLEGKVLIQCPRLTVAADRVEIDSRSNRLVADGDVTLVQGDTHVTGAHLELDLKTRTGTLTRAFAFDAPQVFGTARWAKRLGEDLYQMGNAEVTECRYRHPHWSLSAHRIRLKVGEYIQFTHVLLKIRSVPVLYLPFLRIPIRRERTTGFLFPRFGPNSRKGFFVEEAFFWAINRSHDLTITGRWYADRGPGLGLEYRYVLSARSRGDLALDYYQDRILGKQWQMRWGHSIRWGTAWEWRVDADWFSSFDYITSFGGNFVRRIQIQRYIRSYLTTRWGPFQVYGQFNVQDYSRPGRARNLTAQVPSLRIVMFNRRIGPFTMSMDSSYAYLYRRQGDERVRYHSVSIQPRWSLPWNTLPWLSVTPSLGIRFRMDSQRRDRITRRLDAHPVYQGGLDFSLQVVGPVWYRIFQIGAHTRLKHTIEPIVRYQYGHTWAPQQWTSPDGGLFGGFVGRFGFGRTTHFVSYGMAHRFFVKQGTDPTATPREWLSWTITHSVNLPGSVQIRTDTPRYGPILSSLRWTPWMRLSLQNDIEVHPFRWQLTRVNLSMNWQYTQGSQLALTWTYFRPAQLTTTGTPRAPASQWIRFSWTTPPGGLFQLQIAGAYDISRKQLSNAIAGLIWNQDCFSLGVQVVRYQFGTETEYQFSFSLSIPKVGNLLNFVPGLGGLYGPAVRRYGPRF